MIKVIAFVLAAVVAVAAIGALGFMVVKMIMYMTNQHFGFGDAMSWAWQDFTDFVGGIFGKAKADPDRWEADYTVNKYIEVKACTAL